MKNAFMPCAVDGCLQPSQMPASEYCLEHAKINDGPTLRERLAVIDWRTYIENHDDPPACPHGVMAGNCESCNPPAAPVPPSSDADELIERLRHGDHHHRLSTAEDWMLDAADAIESPRARAEAAERERGEVRNMLQNTNMDAARFAHLADKYKWQVRDTCARAEDAERERDALRAEVEALRAGTERMAARRAVDEERYRPRCPCVADGELCILPSGHGGPHETVSSAAIDAARGKE